MNALFSEDTQKCAMQTVFKMFVAYNRFSIQTKIKYRNYRKQSRLFDLLCGLIDGIISIVTAMLVYITSNRLEPSDPMWVSLCRYIPGTNGTNVTTCDKYSMHSYVNLNYWSNEINDVLDQNKPYYELIKQRCIEAKCELNYCSPPESIDSLIIAKICQNATIIRFAENVNVDTMLTGLTKSSARFLEIEYKCGDGPSLTIEIPKSHYFAGNVILSKTYVLRYLEHLPIYKIWSFNERDYSLRIVDDNSKVFSLDHNQHIQLEQDGYKIVCLDTSE